MPLARRCERCNDPYPDPLDTSGTPSEHVCVQTLEYGPTHPPPSDMWQRWNLGTAEVTGDVVEEEPWWQKHGVEIPTPDRELAHIRD